MIVILTVISDQVENIITILHKNNFLYLPNTNTNTNTIIYLNSLYHFKILLYYVAKTNFPFMTSTEAIFSLWDTLEGRFTSLCRIN